MKVMQGVLKHVRADILADALLGNLENASPAQLSALKLRLADWNRHTKRWKSHIVTSTVEASTVPGESFHT